MRYGSICSGIEAATMAVHRAGLDWQASFFSEIDKFPRAVLQHHYPDVPLHGDFTTIKEDDYDPINILVGGTPCQSFSIAGGRSGLDDARGELSLEFGALASRLGARWIVWENVPGVLSSNGGRDFGAFVGSLVERGYRGCYRVLDAQYFRLAQRRKRVILVAYLGDWRPAAAVLFDRESLRGDPAPGREARQDIAGTLEARASTGGYDPGAHGAASGHLITATAHTLRGEGFDASEDGTGRGTPIIPVECFGGVVGTLCNNGAAAGSATNQDAYAGHIIPTFAVHSRQDPIVGEDIALPLDAVSPQANTICTPINTQLGLGGADTSNTAREGVGIGNPGDPSFTLQANHSHAVQHGMAVRRLTPIECERLQGFPDNFTRIPYRGKPAELCPDGPRYKAIGNSWAVPVFADLFRRIDALDNALESQRPAQGHHSEKVA